MLTTKLARKARAVGLEPDDAGAGRAALTLAALTRRAEGTDPQADDPLAGDGGDIASCTWATCSSPWRTWPSGSASMRSRRCATVHCRCARDILAAEGVPEDQVGNR